MNALNEEIGGAKFEEWRQFNGGAVWKVEQSTIPERSYHRRVLLHLEPSDGVVWSPVTLEDLNILLHTSDSGVRLILLFGGGSGEDAFESIVHKMQVAFESADGRVKGIVRALDHLRSYLELFARKKNLFPSKQTLRGVLGELMTFRRLHEMGMSMSVLLDSWQGPCGGHQDFIFEGSGTAIEVKSALALEAKVRVSNERQLDESGFEALFLCVVRWKEAPGGVDVPTMVNRIMSMMSSGEREKLESMLEEHLKLPRWIRELLPPYRLMELEASPLCYEVLPDSPVLRQSDLEEPVSMVAYDLHYSALEPSRCELDGMVKRLKGEQ